MSVRSGVAAAFTAAWVDIPALADVQVKATERALDQPSKPIALIRTKTVARSAELPMSHRDVGLLVTFISPHKNLDLAMDQLEGLADAFLNYLEQETDIRHSGASTTAWDNDLLALDIPITVLASKE